MSNPNPCGVGTLNGAKTSRDETFTVETGYRHSVPAGAVGLAYVPVQTPPGSASPLMCMCAVSIGVGAGIGSDTQVANWAPAPGAVPKAPKTPCSVSPLLSGVSAERPASPFGPW